MATSIWSLRSSILTTACMVGLMLLSKGAFSVSAAPLVIYPESYIVRYQDALCNSGSGGLILTGSNPPIVLTSTPNLQVQTTTVTSERYQDIWNQNLITDNPPRYQILQRSDGDEPSEYCMYVEADANFEESPFVTTDVCSSTPTTFQQFEYSLVKSASGCDSSNENGYAVQIKPAAVVDIGGNLCFSASSSSGVTVTLETCNSDNENQLFFVNAPTLTTQS